MRIKLSFLSFTDRCVWCVKKSATRCRQSIHPFIHVHNSWSVKQSPPSTLYNVLRDRNKLSPLLTIRARPAFIMCSLVRFSTFSDAFCPQQNIQTNSTDFPSIHIKRLQSETGREAALLSIRQIMPYYRSGGWFTLERAPEVVFSITMLAPVWSAEEKAMAPLDDLWMVMLPLEAVGSR